MSRKPNLQAAESGRAASIYRSPECERELMTLYAEALERWPVSFITHEVPTRYGDTFVIESGCPSAPVLLLLHGTCSNALSWMGDVAAYAPHFRTLAVDVPGEPGRSAPTRPTWSGPSFAQWLEDVLEAMGVSEVALAGLSKGGMVALKYATAYPDRVSRLVLLAAAGIAQVRASFMLRAVPLSLLGSWGRDRMNSLILGSDLADTTVQDWDVVGFMDIIMRNFRPEIAKPYLFSDQELERLTMPTLLIAGSEDPLMDTPRMVDRARRLIPGIDCRPLAGRGHVLVGLTDMILPFLRGT